MGYHVKQFCEIKKKQLIWLFSFRQLAKPFIVLINCVSHDLPAWKLCCSSHKMLCFSRWEKYHYKLYYVFQKLTTSKNVKETGQLLHVCVQSPFSKFGIIFAFFHSSSIDHWCIYRRLNDPCYDWCNNEFHLNIL